MLNMRSPAVPGARSVRIMVVDDSAVVRGLVSRWIGEADGFELVAAAPNGRAALDLVETAAPDIVLLDLDMPELGGIATLPLLLARKPGLKVIVVSTLTQRNAVTSLRCLALGAVDYLPKPSTQQEVTTSLDFRRELMARLDALSGLYRTAAAPGPALRNAKVAERPTEPATRVGIPRPRCLLIGASTGGPRAVMRVLKGLGRVSERVPILVVQHMPPIFTTVFAEQVSNETRIPAREGCGGERIEPGRVYIAPGGRHMGLALLGGEIAIRLDDGPPVRHCRPAVDILFRDAARLFGAGTLGVVLTGMGSDGTDGARAVVEAGGAVIAQDEVTSTVWGMPGSIAKAGLARVVLPLDDIAPALEAALGRKGA
jgi:two-component system chemotaxis response regulator CheB